MNNQPLVSIIMNSYNSDEFLEEAIDSIINQTYQNWEIIFWDNQSTDNSAKIIKSYNDRRIKYFYAPRFTPLGEARNFAIEKCNGEWIGFLDADDIWDKDKLFLSFQELNNSSNEDNISLIYSKSNIINKEGDITSKSTKSPSGYIHDKLLIEGDFIVFSSIIVKKDILNQNGNIDENLNYCEDYDLLLKVCKAYQAIGIDKYLTSYRVHSNNITSTKIYENNIEVVELLNKYIKNNHLSYKIRYNIFINNSYRLGTLMVKLLMIKEYRNIFSLMIKYPFYIFISPFSILYKKIGYQI